WVNHSWLYDWGVYVLGTSGGEPTAGARLVIAKALLVAGLAVLLLLCRPGGAHGLWFGSVLTILGLLSAAPRMLMQPMLLSMVFLAGTLALLFRCRDCKRLPIYVGVLFALWASCDAWFILGPAALALFTFGEFLQRRFGRPDASGDPVSA